MNIGHCLILATMQLMAYQIAFDLEENATQDFLSKVSRDLPQPETGNQEGGEEQEVSFWIFNPERISVRCL